MAKQVNNEDKVPTQEEVDAYLSGIGVHCIFSNCESENIDAENIGLQESGAPYSCSCKDCGGAWTDIYRLVAIVAEEEDGQDVEMDHSPVLNLTDAQKSIIRCAYSDLVGSLQNHNKYGYGDEHDWEAHKKTIKELEAFDFVEKIDI